MDPGFVWINLLHVSLEVERQQTPKLPNTPFKRTKKSENCSMWCCLHVKVLQCAHWGILCRALVIFSPLECIVLKILKTMTNDGPYIMVFLHFQKMFWSFPWRMTPASVQLMTMAPIVTPFQGLILDSIQLHVQKSNLGASSQVDTQTHFFLN